MSDTLQGTPVQELPNEAEGGPGAGRRRLLIGVVIGAGLLVLAAATYFLFLSGGSSDDAFAPITQGTPAAAPNGGKQSGQGDGGNAVPQKVDNNLQVGQDPFEPLAAEAPIVVADPVATAGTGTDPTSAGDTSATATVYSVTLKSVNLKKGSADIDIDGKLYTVGEGDVFPSTTTGPFKLVKVDASDNGQGQVSVTFGSDLPVVLSQGTAADFTVA